jgi:galactoside O-acetyltransferase
MLKRIFNDLLVSILRNISGSTGRKLRYYYYKNKFKTCGINVYIDEGVIFLNPQMISIGNNVWIDRYSIITAGKASLNNSSVKKIDNKNFLYSEGELIIGDGVHIGAFNILQAHSGIFVGSYVTTSSGVKIYSLSNYPFDENNTNIITYTNSLVGEERRTAYITSPIVIEEGVWLALDCIVLGGTIGKNSFVTTGSVVINDISENSYASGNPAVKIKNRFKLEENN